ncbi:MAG: hypothetical protein IJG13_02490 [Kiritimatiellae bacterium]|nr:hypothetical protein [Kiritimatiellia bacterium]
MNFKVGVSWLWVLGCALPLVAGIQDEPDGCAVKLLPGGGFQVTAIGSGDYQFNNPAAIRNARKTAEMRAKAALAKFLKEDLSTSEGMEEATKNTLALASDGQSENKQATMESVSSTMESIRNSASALLTGVVVLEDAKVPSGGIGGSYRVKVGVSSKTTAVASSAGNGISTSLADSGASAPAAPAPAPSVAPAGGEAAAGAAAAPEGLPPVPDGWIVCTGYGADRKKAVQAALIEGISQVYGQMLQNDERMTERMKQIQTSASAFGKVVEAAAMSNTQQSESSTLTKTAGFVREFRIIQVIPKDGNQEATVYAYIVNPRAGGPVALRVCKPTMTIEDKSTIYQLGPKTRMSGAEVAKAIQFALPNGLAKANKFLILNDKSLKAVIENKAATTAMVAVGLAGAQELMQAGQGLTPDYSLRTEIKDIKYSKKLGQDKKTKKFGQMYKMSIKIEVTLMNDRTGQAVKSDTITLALDNDEIKGLLEEDEDADLLQAALSKLAEPIEQWIGGK